MNNLKQNTHIVVNVHGHTFSVFLSLLTECQQKTKKTSKLDQEKQNKCKTMQSDSKKKNDVASPI